MDTEYRIQMMEKMQKKISRSTDNALRTSLLGENMNDSRSLKVVNQGNATYN
ncbi:Hypothetical predicted protein [Mytilus galloprovincialis]|uniref:Uncharacterized protein n=1 Tax=Mytilus galloprovincialis TaxID=29158 RepID=A0A8B6C5U4_MYTGA|nr:Hypothetical predicted protein [Mytilus galloprovincialis]